MRLSVVVATRNRARYVEHLLRDLAAQRKAPPFEAVIVDNASEDDTRAVVESAREYHAYPIRYLYEPEPNRAKARNRGIRAAEGYIVVFTDDDVALPDHFLAAHEAAHDRSNLVVGGPIVNVPSYEHRPAPTPLHWSRAFLCTCNASVPRHALEAVGGFDERFDLYGWEDTELGLRLRAHGMRRRFAWDAYLWHIKPPEDATLEVEARKAVEKARMAARFLRAAPGVRTRLATGAHPVNVLRGRYLYGEKSLALLAGIAASPEVPPPVRALARAQFLDGLYTRELATVLEHERR